MKNHKIIGGGGVELNVVETGNPDGRPILFITGFSQSHLSWKHQLNSDLTNDHRLIAFDLRGHGTSGKPESLDAYTDSKLWADDVNAMIQTLSLESPILSGWSYGPLIILDYVRYYGEEHVGGIHFVGGITKLGTEEAGALLTPDILGLVPGFFSTNVDESIRDLSSLIRLFFVRQPTEAELYFMLGYNVSVPPHVRQALFSRSLDNDDVLTKLKTPLLISHSVDDKIVYFDSARQIASLVPHAQIHQMANVGHAVFWEDAAGFNNRLREFAVSLDSRNADVAAAT
jgi:non-heme chloroperoxidase